MNRRGFMSLFAVILISGCTRISNIVRGTDAPPKEKQPKEPKESFWSKFKNIFKRSPKSEPLVDTDGDGMIDSKDYAPWDPDVQRKFDVSEPASSPPASSPPASSPPASSPPASSPPASSPPASSPPASSTYSLPLLEAANLVSELTSIGDVTSKKLTSAKVGDSLLIAFKYRALVHSTGKTNVLQQVILSDSNSNELQRKSKTSEQEGSADSTQIIVYAIRFSSKSLSPGNYVAKVLLRDETTKKVSKAITVPFTLT